MSQCRYGCIEINSAHGKMETTNNKLIQIRCKMIIEGLDNKFGKILIV